MFKTFASLLKPCVVCLDLIDPSGTVCIWRPPDSVNRIFVKYNNIKSVKRMIYLVSQAHLYMRAADGFWGYSYW